MLGDALRKVVSGEPFRMPAAAYNSFVDAANYFKGQQFNGGGAQSERFRQGDIIRIRNDSGRDAAQFDVLGIDGPIITPAANLSQFKERVAVSGSTPTEDHEGRFAVLLEPIADGKMGRGFVSGVTVARVQVEDDDHKRADVNPDDPTSLLTNNDGSAFILWKGECIVRSGATAASGDDTTLCWAIVRLSNPPLGLCGDYVIAMHDVRCVNGRLQKWVTETKVDSAGCIITGDPVFVGHEGCCDCGGSGSGSGSGLPSAVLPPGSGSGGGGDTTCCPDVDLGDTLYATISAPGFPWLDGEVIELINNDGVWSGAKWEGTPGGCFFPLHLTCCDMFPELGLNGDECADFVLNQFIDPSVYNVVPCTSSIVGVTPSSCSCDPFTLIFQRSFNGHTGDFRQPRFRCGTGCAPMVGGFSSFSNCSATWTVTITT